MSTVTRSHPGCWTGTAYQHTCHRPSGRPCIDCGAPAGTPWTPLWCPDCDVARLDRISADLDRIMAFFSAPSTHVTDGSRP